MEENLNLAESLFEKGLTRSTDAKTAVVFKNLKKAAANAEYKCDLFIKPFEPKKKVTEKKVSKKKTEAKTVKAKAKTKKKRKGL